MSKEVEMIAISFLLLVSFIVLGAMLGLFATVATIIIVELLQELYVTYPVLAIGAMLGAIAGFIVWWEKVAVKMP